MRRYVFTTVCIAYRTPIGRKSNLRVRTWKTFRAGKLIGFSKEQNWKEINARELKKVKYGGRAPTLFDSTSTTALPVIPQLLYMME